MKMKLIGLALALISNMSLAANTRAKKKKNPNMQSVAAQTEQLPISDDLKEAKPLPLGSQGNELPYGSSAANRQNKTFSLTGEPIGFAPLPVYGIAAGYYLTPNQILEVSYAQGEIDLLITTINNSMASLHLKSFWSNSFYTNLGVAQRTLGYSFLISEVDSNGNFTARNQEFLANNSAFGVDFSIGNRWQWNTFSLGCDWVGFFLPVAVTGETTIQANSSYDPQDIEDANKDMDRFSKRGTIQFLRFYLGVSF